MLPKGKIPANPLQPEWLKATFETDARRRNALNALRMSSAQKPAPTTRAAEELLASLAGIVSAHVVADDTGRLVEIHILCTPDIHPKQVVRNVESALTAGLGLHIDRRVVSVAQIRSSLTAEGEADEEDLSPALGALVGDEGEPAQSPGDRQPAPESTPARVEFVRFEARRDAEYCTCDVTLIAHGREIIGTSSGADTAPGRAEAAARAVFNALEQARPDLRLELEGAVIAAARGANYVIVAAHALLDRNTVPLAGAAPLARSPEEAAILAALQATNRWSA